MQAAPHTEPTYTLAVPVKAPQSHRSGWRSLRVTRDDARLTTTVVDTNGLFHPDSLSWPDPVPELVQALALRTLASGTFQIPPELVHDGFSSMPAFTMVALPENPAAMDNLATKVLTLPRSERWREAISTALLGDWSDPLLRTGQLPATALGVLKADARAIHRELMPIWRRRTRHGRVLSLDADLGGLSLHDLVAAGIDLLTHTTGGVFEDERLNIVLRGLNDAERLTLLAYAEGDGTTWTEAAAVTGAADPEAFGERVRRKAKRLATEQARRAAQRHFRP
ncbi:hypothetical protein [Streptomyces sp. IBSBF 2806]|uniref:hypothetical protein n=1 Tax=Streptomyces sp. IBSBF 2806 TaxID=2903529 RepID=UPI002FDBDB99